MLERHALLVQDWTPTASGGADARRMIVDPVTHQRVGFARWRSPLHRWLRWLRPPVLSVHEIEDDSLLFTAQRIWGFGPRWEIQDADDHPVGTLRSSFLHDRLGRAVAVVDGERMRGTSGGELATQTRTALGTHLHFTPAVDGEPFIKMLLLAAILIVD